MGISAALGSSALLPAGLGFRNLLINGNIAIDQRNAGASVTVNSTSNFYGPDRWQAFGQASDGTFTIQRVSSSPTPPAGFTYALKIATGTADTSIAATQTYGVIYKVEGLDAAQFAWGTSGAKQAVLSFWAYGSKTGTYGGSVSNSAFNRSFPFSYTINATNTWEYKTVYITGDTSGTWLTDTGIGIRIEWSVGAGSTQLGTAGAWAGTRYDGATGQTNLIATADSLTITGVQFEQNYQPTPFEQRPYGVELQLCQRYYWRLSAENTGVGQRTGGFGRTYGSNTFNGQIRLPVRMRIRPTSSLEYSGLFATDDVNFDSTGGTWTIAPTYCTSESLHLGGSPLGGVALNTFCSLGIANNTGYIAISAEL